MRVAHKPSTWGLQADFAAVSSHPAALGFTRTWSFPFLARTIVIIHAVVIFAQHRQIRRLRMPAVVVSVDVVNLASIGRHIAVWPRAHEILCHGEGAELVAREACLIGVGRCGGGGEWTDG